MNACYNLLNDFATNVEFLMDALFCILMQMILKLLGPEGCGTKLLNHRSIFLLFSSHMMSQSIYHLMLKGKVGAIMFIVCVHAFCVVA